MLYYGVSAKDALNINKSFAVFSQKLYEKNLKNKNEESYNKILNNKKKMVLVKRQENENCCI